MKRSSFIHALLGSALSVGLLVPWSADAALSSFNVCPALSPEVRAPAGVQVPKVCYSGFNCTIGMRGDWLDITNQVSFNRTPTTPSPPVSEWVKAEASIAARGDSIRASNSCVPVSQKDREGYVAVLLEEITTSGPATVTARRPAFNLNRTDADRVPVEVRDGTHFLHPIQRGDLTVRAGELRTIQLTGRGLQDVRVKPQPEPARMPSMVLQKNQQRVLPAVKRMADPSAAPPPPAEPVADAPRQRTTIVSKSYDRLSLQVTFLRSGTISLEDYLEFTVGDPAINRDLGWPSIQVTP